MKVKITKKSAKDAGVTAGGIATGAIAAHVATSIIPKINPTVDIIIPFGITGAAITGAMAVQSPIAKVALLTLGTLTFFKGTKDVANRLATPNAEGKAVLSESVKKAIDSVVPSLGNIKLPLASVEDMDMIKPTIDLGNVQLPLAMEEEIEEVMADNNIKMASAPLTLAVS